MNEKHYMYEWNKHTCKSIQKDTGEYSLVSSRGMALTKVPMALTGYQCTCFWFLYFKLFFIILLQYLLSNKWIKNYQNKYMNKIWIIIRFQKQIQGITPWYPPEAWLSPSTNGSHKVSMYVLLLFIFCECFHRFLFYPF